MNARFSFNGVLSRPTPCLFVLLARRTGRQPARIASILFFLFLLLHTSCRHGRPRTIQRSFYYWKTVFKLSPAERQTLERLSVKHLYVKLFDVEWDNETNVARPVAKSVFTESQPSNLAITPVVFITQEPLQKLDSTGLDSLAANIADLLFSIASTNRLRLSNEVQLDCDWTQSTRSHYFRLVERLKQQAFFQNKTVSATVRLHQLKFVSQNGVPPVHKGLLMAYNMGNLRHAKTQNSIIDEDELKKYVANLKNYPLPLDVALPIFDWWVLFEGERYKGLLREFNPGEEAAENETIFFERDTSVNGYAFKAGQWLRREGSDAAAVRACAEAIGRKLKSKSTTVILYHLDDRNLTKYTLHELESFYDGLR